MTSTRVSFTSAGKPVAAELFAPPAAATPVAGPLVALAYGTEGLNPPVGGILRRFAGELAAAGIAVVIPDYLAVTGTAPGVDSVFAPTAPADRFDAWVQVLGDALNPAAWPDRALPAGANPSRTGLVGFSLGGHLVLRAAAGRAIKAVVDFFGPVAQLAPHSKLQSASVRDFPPVQIHHGDADDVVSIRESLLLDTWLSSNLVRHELLVYPGNGHPGPARPDWSVAAQAESTAECIRFLRRYL